MNRHVGRGLALMLATALIYAVIMNFVLRVLHWGFMLSLFTTAVVGTVASTLLLHLVGEKLNKDDDA